MESQISELRRWLAGLLPPCETRDDVMTVAVELATNAVRHTASGRGGWFMLEVTRYRFAVGVAVADAGAEDEPRIVDEPMSECGRGLQVVHALSSHTGVAGDRRGRLVWAEIPWALGDAPALDGATALDGTPALNGATALDGTPALDGPTTLDGTANACTALDGGQAAVRDGADILAPRPAGAPAWFCRPASPASPASAGSHLQAS